MTGPARGRAALLLAALLVLAGTARGADDAVTRGKRLFEKHRYGEAALALRSHLLKARPGSPGNGEAALLLGAAYLKNAQLHRSLHRTAVAVQADYLGRLASERGRGKSALAEYFLGEALLAGGRPAEAKGHFERFLGARDGATEEAALATVGLGLCHERMGDPRRTTGLWKGLSVRTPAVKAALAAAYVRVGRPGEGKALAGEALAAVGKAGRRAAPGVLADIAMAFARAGFPEKGLDVVGPADLSARDREEVLGKDKVVRFHDPWLLENLSVLYGEASVHWLAKAAEDPPSRDAATYYLGEAYAFLGDAAKAERAAFASVSAARLPSSFRDRASVRRAALRLAAGEKREASKTFDELSRRQPLDPDLLADIVSACGSAQDGCPDVVGRAQAVAEGAAGKRLRPLQAALGRHFLAKKEPAKALAWLEGARDKGNKNKVEGNDPELLADLAEAGYRTRLFSEAQEIYFGLAQSVPAVRQIQEALQGIYSREQKSAGDARIL